MRITRPLHQIIPAVHRQQPLATSADYAAARSAVTGVFYWTELQDSRAVAGSTGEKPRRGRQQARSDAMSAFFDLKKKNA